MTEVYCCCPPELAVQRFVARRRHAGHGDRLRPVDDLLTQFTALDALGPLGVGTVVEVDTAEPVDIGEVVERIGCA